MGRKSERSQLLERVFEERLPQLEAASAAAQEYDEAGTAIGRAELRRREAAERLRLAYDVAVQAGWTEADLRVVGVDKPRRAGGRQARVNSAGEAPDGPEHRGE